MSFDKAVQSMRTYGFISMVYVLAAVAAVCSCKSDPRALPAEVSAGTDTLSFGKEGGEQTVMLTATRDWVAEVSYVNGDTSDWLTLGSSSGSASSEPVEITVSVGADKDSDREAVIVFRADFIEDRVRVIQKGEHVDYTTIEEFVDAPLPSSDSEAVWYEMCGTIISIEDTYYGNFWIKDRTGILYVYGLTASQVERNDNTFASLELEIGDELVFKSRRAEYGGVPQAGGSRWPAYYVSHTDREDLEVDDDLVSDPVSLWMELPEVEISDGRAFVYYMTEADGKPVRNYSMLYDASERVALWVAYPLTSGYIGTGRTDAWNFDPKIPDIYEPVIPRSWGVDGYDRGHQVPSGSRNANDGMNEQTFYFANMTVQNSDLNQTVWMELENMEREYALECDTLYVVTGPILDVDGDGGIARIEDNAGNKVAVPEAYFKVLLSYDAAGNTYRSIAFYYDNADCSRQTPHADDIRTVAQIEDLTGFRFFPNLPDDVEASVKEFTDPEDWGF